MKIYYVPILHQKCVDSFTYISSDCDCTSFYRREKQTQESEITSPGRQNWDSNSEWAGSTQPTIHRLFKQSSHLAQNQGSEWIFVKKIRKRYCFKKIIPLIQSLTFLSVHPRNSYSSLSPGSCCPGSDQKLWGWAVGWKFLLQPTRRAIKMTDSMKEFWGREEIRTLTHCWWECKVVQPH